MQQINSAMVQTVKGMSNAMKNMQVEQIASTMQNFEKQFEDMDVRSGLRIWGLLLFLLSSSSSFFLLLFCIFCRIHGGHDGVHHWDIHPAGGSGQFDTGAGSGVVRSGVSGFLAFFGVMGWGVAGC
jgi:hypothetical protein